MPEDEQPPSRFRAVLAKVELTHVEFALKCSGLLVLDAAAWTAFGTAPGLGAVGASLLAAAYLP